MNERVPFTPEEQNELKELYQSNFRKFSVSVFGVIVAGFLFFLMIKKVPARFLGNDDIDGTLADSLGPSISGLITALICLYIIIVLNNEWKITKLRSDLKNGEKIIAQLKVIKIYHIPPKDLEELQSVGHEYTSELQFDKNIFGIVNYPFNKLKQPELLATKQLYLEMAPKSKYEFKRIIS